MTRVHKAKQIELVLKSHMTRKLSHDIQIPPTTKVLSLEDLNFQTQLILFLVPKMRKKILIMKKQNLNVVTCVKNCLKTRRDLKNIILILRYSVDFAVYVW